MADIERRSDQVTVIMPTEIIPAEILAPATAEDPDKFELDLGRTKKYIKKYVLDRPMGEVWKEINEQMVMILLLVRDASLKWLEIWTNSKDHKEREEAKQHFIALTHEASTIAEQRQVIAKAMGLNISGEVGAEERETMPTLYDPKPLTKEEFEKQFLPLIPKPIVLDQRVEKK